MTTIGPVLDLSQGGMRVLSTRRREGTLNVRIFSYDVTVAVRAKVAWSQRLGFRRHELGISFLEVDEQLASVLKRISTAHRECRSLPPTGSA